MKTFLRLGAIISVSLFLLFCLVMLLAARNVVTGTDRDTTFVISDEFKQAVQTNFQRQIEIIVSPSHNRTIIHVKSPVSDDEKKTLSALANNISLKNLNRKIDIVYR